MRSVALIGNPNTGKTTLFNSLTHSREHVGNWQGVTVDSKSKIVKVDGQDIQVVDLPGTYSLRCRSPEEQVTIDHALLGEYEIINIVDKSNLRRNLYLTLQLCERNIPFVLAINNTSRASLDVSRLIDITGWDCREIDASKRKNNDFYAKNRSKIKKLSYLSDPKLKEILKEFRKYDNKYDIIRVIDALDDDLASVPSHVAIEVRKMLGERSPVEYMASLRYGYIDDLLDRCGYVSRVYGAHQIDNILLNRFLAIPIFLAILAGVFYLTFSSVGLYLSDTLKALLDSLLLKNIVSRLTVAGWFRDLLATIAGVLSTVVSFLPQIAIVFMFLSMLEDSGYLSRIAFLFDDILGKVGLSGKSVFSLLMGFGCTTTALMSTKTLDGATRLKTIILTPFVSCSAKMPLFVLLCGVFFRGNFLVVYGLYIFLFLLLIAMSYMINIFIRDESSFIMEFVPLRRPRLKKTLYEMYNNCKMFLLRVTTITVAMSIIMWVLESFNFSLKYVGRGGNSILKGISMVLAPLFIPLGLNNWGVVSSLISGIFAKEMIISSIAVVNGVEGAAIGGSLLHGGIITFTAAQAFIFMLFCLTYCPCVSTLAVMKREIGFKKTVVCAFVQFLVTYLICMLVRLMIHLVIHYMAAGVSIAAACLLLIASIIVIIRHIAHPIRCKSCSKYKVCKKHK